MIASRSLPRSPIPTTTFSNIAVPPEVVATTLWLRGAWLIVEQPSSHSGVSTQPATGPNGSDAWGKRRTTLGVVLCSALTPHARVAALTFMTKTFQENDAQT
jgi:hypothetical protein